MLSKDDNGSPTNSIPVQIGQTAAEGQRQGELGQQNLDRTLADQFDRSQPGNGGRPHPDHPGPRQGGI
jgi:hypothetical protein